jgi:hypothetical protein
MTRIPLIASPPGASASLTEDLRTLVTRERNELRSDRRLESSVDESVAVARLEDASEKEHEGSTLASTMSFAGSMLSSAGSVDSIAGAASGPGGAGSGRFVKELKEVGTKVLDKEFEAGAKVGAEIAKEGEWIRSVELRAQDRGQNGRRLAELARLLRDDPAARRG